MKNINFFSALRSVSVSLAIVLIAGAIFVYSLNSARASEFPEQFNAAQIEKKLSTSSTASIGKYMFAYQLINDPTDNKFYHFVIVWDSETAKSKIYIRNGANYVPSTTQLPENPLQ